MRDYTPQNYELFCIAGNFGMVLPCEVYCTSELFMTIFDYHLYFLQYRHKF